ncbi:uncharacterized protein LOC133524982 isoform X2 [Cydia pomonella]|uniref:uncharacterized protein LOC133524982 isoform X2 n=1 Tax=Cydia pomonella TaxID=82600 RepID=UPI002ADD60E6|nr:uncharacterized protein LOC133524982 isoform X2 [Cydia pomonella]
MNQGDQNINKDMIDCDLIDVESLDFSDEQTWLNTAPEDAGVALDIVDWQLSFDWPFTEDADYLQTETELYSVLDHLLKNDVAAPNKHKFDSRTFVKPKKRAQRPSIQSIVENPPTPNKYLTYNKYSAPLGPLSPILRLKTFNVETDTDNSNAIKEYASKRRSLVSEEEGQLDEGDMTLVSEASERLSSDHLPSKPINIDLSQPAHNLHNTFNKGLTNIMSERGSLNMYQSGESLMRMSPPSLVSSLMMESSGNFNPESMDSRKSLSSHRDSGIPPSGRESIDPMMTSMTLSILDEKDMSTSFLSQTTYPDNDSLMDSLPPSLVSSVNSSYIVSNMSKQGRESTDSNNIFSSATFTHLEQSEKLLSARPRHQPFNHFQKRENEFRKSESYTKAKEEACQIDPSKILMENGDKNTTKTSNKSQMSETVTLHYSNSKFRRDEKENLNSTFEKDDAYLKDMQRTADMGKNSLNVTLDKQELNEIIQARQKLSLARKALPETEKLPNQADTAIKTIQLPNQTITVPRHSMENASELLSRRRMNNSFDKEEPPTRETPKRNATFKKVSPRIACLDSTVVYAANKDESELIDINLATTNLIESSEMITLEDWGSQQRAMVCSSESTDTGTFSSSSPPDSVPDTQHDPSSISSTPLIGFRKPKDLLNIHTTISPIYDMVDDKSYTVTKVTGNSPMERTYDKSYNMNKASANSSMDKTYDMHATVINTATMVKKSSAKRDILAGKVSPNKKMFGPSVPVKAQSMDSCVSAMAPPVAVSRKTGLPTSKLRQYSSHKELSRIPGTSVAARALPRSNMVRRGVYASNPALSPTHPALPAHPAHHAHHAHHPHPAPIRRDSYTLDVDGEAKSAARPVVPNQPALVRQGTETLRRERPQSQLVAPKDLRASGIGLPVAMRNHHMPPPPTRPYSIAGASQLRVVRPATVPVQKPVSAAPVPEARPASSALPRPSRLPAPRRALRPPSTYSVAPTADLDHY